MDKGWIKVHRKLIEKSIWINSTPEQKVILITLLMMANRDAADWEWKGERFSVKPGQFVTSLEKLKEKCGKGITIQNVRTAINRFEKMGFLTNESTKTGRLITIANWGIYQGREVLTNNDINNELTNNQQTTNKQLTPNKNNKNDKKNKNIYTNVIPIEEIHFMKSQKAKKLIIRK